ncbi:hypothetical protein OHS70_21625 [Streptomyces sp. NBC_00390]|uniref:hypothetical protein n=1 Tax=Streptomyces sp. NBC_00390 TaxID=2975736 RepID=UPI002E1AE061
MTSGPRERSRLCGLLGLLGAGVLAAVGGFLSNPWLIMVGAMVVVMAYLLRCRIRRCRGAVPL